MVLISTVRLRLAHWVLAFAVNLTGASLPFPFAEKGEPENYGPLLVQQHFLPLSYRAPSAHSRKGALRRHLRRIASSAQVIQRGNNGAPVGKGSG